MRSREAALLGALALLDVSLSTEERIELLTHRCFIVTDKPHGDLWPFDDTYEEAKPNW